MSAETLFFAIGLSQLLESYCIASLESQYSTHFPIQVWLRIDEAKSELQRLFHFTRVREVYKPATCVLDADSDTLILNWLQKTSSYQD